MGKIPDNPGADRHKVGVTECSLLVAHGQSKKLPLLLTPLTYIHVGKIGGYTQKATTGVAGCRRTIA